MRCLLCNEAIGPRDPLMTFLQLESEHPLRFRNVPVHYPCFADDLADRIAARTGDAGVDDDSDAVERIVARVISHLSR